MKTMTSSVPLVEQALIRLETAPFDEEALEMMYRHTHTIGRAASLMEHPALAQLAHGMEGTLADVLEGFARLDPPTLILLRQALGTMQTLLNHLYTRNPMANASSSAESVQDAERAGLVVEATLSETDGGFAPEHRGGPSREGATAREAFGGRRPSWWPKTHANGSQREHSPFFVGQRFTRKAGREPEEEARDRNAEPGASAPGPRRQDHPAARAIDLIRALQQQRKTGKLTIRRGSGMNAEEGWIQFFCGQITSAASGRHRDAEARNWLSTWGNCRYVFEETDPSP